MDACPNEKPVTDADGDGCEDPPPPPTGGDCETPLQQRIDAAASGDTLNVRGCTFREAITVNKPLTIDGGSNAESAIKGSDDWTSNFSSSGGNYVSGKSVPALTPDINTRCENDGPECTRVEQVFVDGVEQKQLANGADPGAGEFSLDASRRVVLGSDPGSKKVEVTTRDFVLQAAANNVTLKNLTVEHAANRAQSGMVINATNNVDYDGFVIENSVLQNAHSVALSIFDDGAQQSVKTGEIISTKILNNGQLGVGNSKGWLEIRGPNCEISHNGFGGYERDWEAGGGKFGGILRGGTFHKVTVNGCTVEKNMKGLWTDVDAQNITFTNNRVFDNEFQGLQLEITNGALIKDNVAYDNGYGDPRKYGWGANIQSASSRNVEITGNVTAWGPDGITVMSADRCIINRLPCDGSGVNYNDPRNIKVHHNTILHTDRTDGRQPYGLGWMHDWNSPLFDPANGNVGYDNLYYYPLSEGAQGAGQRFAYDEQVITSLATFNATLGEERGRYLSASEKDAVLTEYALSAQPAR